MPLGLYDLRISDSAQILICVADYYECLCPARGPPLPYRQQ